MKAINHTFFKFEEKTVKSVNINFIGDKFTMSIR